MQHRIRGQHKTHGLALTLACLAFYLAATSYAPPAAADSDSDDDSFLASDDYKDGDEIVGVFLKDAEYAKMHEDFEHNDTEFDWGWMADNVSLPKGATAHLVVKDDFGVFKSGFKDNVAKQFKTALKRLGLTVIANDKPAQYELGLDIVDYKASSTNAFFYQANPFVELEIRLKNLSNGKDLVLIRDQNHGDNPGIAATELARNFMQLLK